MRVYTTSYTGVKRKNPADLAGGRGVMMLDWLFNKLEEITCKHDYELIDEYKGINGFGLIGYCSVYRCKKCGKVVTVTYYP